MKVINTSFDILVFCGLESALIFGKYLIVPQFWLQMSKCFTSRRRKFEYDGEKNIYMLAFKKVNLLPLPVKIIFSSLGLWHFRNVSYSIVVLFRKKRHSLCEEKEKWHTVNVTDAQMRASWHALWIWIDTFHIKRGIFQGDTSPNGSS